MIVRHDQGEVISRLVRCADGKDLVRAVLLTSTRARPRAPVDVLSDYDVGLVLEDIRPFFEPRFWLEDCGKVLVAYWDAIEPEPDHDMEHTGNVVQYADGLKVDLRLWPVALLRRIAYAPAMPEELDAGYVELLDKDRLTDDLDPPTFEAYVPGRPDEGAYLMWVNDFFSDAPYVAKCLWRDELFPGKWCLDYDMKQIYLRRNAGVEDGVEDGARPRLVGADGLGREGAEETVPPEVWKELEGTCAGAGIEENWEGPLPHARALFRRVAVEVADDLGYAYPHDLDWRVTEYVPAIRDLDPGSADR